MAKNNEGKKTAEKWNATMASAGADLPALAPATPAPAPAPASKRRLPDPDTEGMLLKVGKKKKSLAVNPGVAALLMANAVGKGKGRGKGKGHGKGTGKGKGKGKGTQVHVTGTFKADSSAAFRQDFEDSDIEDVIARVDDGGDGLGPVRAFLAETAAAAAAPRAPELSKSKSPPSRKQSPSKSVQESGRGRGSRRVRFHESSVTRKNRCIRAKWRDRELPSHEYIMHSIDKLRADEEDEGHGQQGQALPNGIRVVMKGLITEKSRKYNDQYATVLKRLDRPIEAYEVKLEGDNHTIIRVRRSNLARDTIDSWHSHKSVRRSQAGRAKSCSRPGDGRTPSKPYLWYDLEHMHYCCREQGPTRAELQEFVRRIMRSFVTNVSTAPRVQNKYVAQMKAVAFVAQQLNVPIPDEVMKLVR